jgi:hypothetical protein
MTCQVSFDEPTHTYRNTSTNEIYTSVTTKLHKYTNLFDEIRISEEYVARRPGQGLTPEGVRAEWKDINTKALTKGSTYHLNEELESLWTETNLNQDYNDYVVDIAKLPDGVYPELRLYLHKYKLAGTADKIVIETINGIRYVDVFDHKTNSKELSKKGFKGQTMLYPLNYLQDAEYYHYEMQLNIYAWILEQYGYVVRNIEIFHKRFLDDQEIPFDHMPLWGATEENLRKVRNYKYQYLPHRIKSFIDYDWETNNRQGGTLF